MKVSTRYFEIDEEIRTKGKIFSSLPNVTLESGIRHPIDMLKFHDFYRDNPIIIANGIHGRHEEEDLEDLDREFRGLFIPKKIKEKMAGLESRFQIVSISGFKPRMISQGNSMDVIHSRDSQQGFYAISPRDLELTYEVFDRYGIPRDLLEEHSRGQIEFQF